jgi:flagellar secretion chaperone FliS
MQQYDAYQKTTFDTSDNVRLVSLLFEGAINFLKRARERMDANDLAGKGLYIGKATAIVGELTSSLNLEQGGEIARNLRRLYEFVLDRLLKANMKNDATSLDEAMKVLGTLRDGWKEMERSQAAAHTAPARTSGPVGMAVQA